MDGDRLVQRWMCRGATMPDGKPGAWWRGVLYPLLDGDRIDLAAPEPEPVAQTAHAVLPGEEASWILIRGSAKELEAARVSLARDGQIITRHGRWLGEPVGGCDFDWFIRCNGWVGPDTVASLLNAPAATAEADPVARAAVLEQRLADMRADLAALNEALERVRRAPPPELRSPAPDAGADRGGLIEALHQQIDALQARLVAEVPPQPLVAPAPSRGELRLRDELLDVLAAFRPDVRLLRDSITVITGEFSTRTAVWRTIRELPFTGSRPDGWKMLRGADRWWERHLGTGQSDTGRAYARFDKQQQHWSLLISTKGEQERDIAWLSRQ
jgi:hypothetical protein